MEFLDIYWCMNLFVVVEFLPQNFRIYLYFCNIKLVTFVLTFEGCAFHVVIITITAITVIVVVVIVAIVATVSVASQL